MGKLKKILLISGLIVGTLHWPSCYITFLKKPVRWQGCQSNHQRIFRRPTDNLYQPANAPPLLRPGIQTPGAALPVAGVLPSAKPSYYQTEATQKIVEGTASYASVGANGVRYYNPADGKFYITMPDGTIKVLSDQTFYNAQKITWADKQNKAVIEYPDNSKIIFNFDAQKQVTLPKHWEEFSFSSDGTQLAAKSIGLSPENRWLVTTNDDGTGTKLIEPMGKNADKVIVDWSPSQQVTGFTMTGEGIGMYRKEVLMIGLHGENFKSFVAEGLGFQPQWSPTGKKLLYSVYSNRSDFKPEIWIVNSYGQEIGSGRKNLELNTWANKCAFANDNTLFCAVPKSLPSGSGINPAVASGATDNVYKIDLKTGLKTSINTGGSYNILNLSYNELNQSLIFTDANQSGIFEIKL